MTEMEQEWKQPMKLCSIPCMGSALLHKAGLSEPFDCVDLRDWNTPCCEGCSDLDLALELRYTAQTDTLDFDV